MSNTQTKLLDLNEAAARLHVCKRMFYRLVQQKHLPPPLKVGRKSLVLESDIEGYLAALIRARNDA
ncbi:MAG: helix-turn-helix domain-containing protein [Verrucomicrobia bacterium]|nr:helix-turn-helix domain-containing protein [Verrucomicrobiota bacterium]